MADERVQAVEPVSERLADEPPRPTSRWNGRTQRVLLGSLLAVGLAGVGVVGVGGWRILREKDAALTPPGEVAGLVRDDSAEARETADYLRTALAAGMGLDQTVSAVYEDPARTDRDVLFLGGTTLVFSPERKLDALFELLTDGAGGVTGIREVPAGRLGGVMRCGTTAADEGDMAVCGWADHGSVAGAMFPGRSPDESAPLLRTMRTAIQTRG
jgi:hypothetical protein